MASINSKQVSAFSLKPADVDAICFWTKNPKPLMEHLDELDERSLNYYFQFTLNPYPKQFEPNVPPMEERIATFRELAVRIGPERVVWRYDPVILTSATPVSWHLDQLERIAGQLQASTRRLVFSFYDFYGKGQGRLHAALKGTGIVLEDLSAPEQEAEMLELVKGFKTVCDHYGLRLFSCSEDVDLSALGIEHGACIDGQLIHDLFGSAPSMNKDKNQRQSCGCVESVDMGIYNTCHFRCSYCYANFNEAMIESNCRKHYQGSPSLLDRYDKSFEIQTSLKKKKCTGYQPLLDGLS